MQREANDILKGLNNQEWCEKRWKDTNNTIVGHISSDFSDGKVVLNVLCMSELFGR